MKTLAASSSIPLQLPEHPRSHIAVCAFLHIAVLGVHAASTNLVEAVWQ